MSGRTITQEQFEQLEAYILHRMDAEERARFEAAMEHDPVLRGEYETQRRHTLALELGGMQELLRGMPSGTGENRPGRERRWGRMLKYAAMVALLAAAAVWWSTRPSANERAFASQYRPDPGLPVPMSIVDAPQFHDAMVAYKLGEMEEAIGKWRPLLQKDPANDTLLYFMAQAELQLGDAESAGPRFAAVAADGTSAFQGKARWYLYLSLLRQGDFARMDSLHMEQDPIYGERARTIRGQLGR